ncbi:MAG: terminase large subunit domain-containing protein [Candidatus Heimdallarchaeaceae archaeon]
MKLDKWQEEVLATKGHLCVCSGRQSGKSTIISQHAGEYATKNSKKVIMIVASVERQALLLFEKVLSYIYLNYKKMIKKGKDKPTKHKLTLTNGSIIHCLPTGDSGYGIRGYTIDRLYADEAAFIPEDVWAAVTPMLVTTGGDIVLLSTPMGTTGYFYRCFHDKKFHSIHVNTEDVAKERLEPQSTMMLEFLKGEKERMTKLQYQQEYLGMFVGGIMRFFPDDIIKKCMTNKIGSSIGDRFLGVDVARMGGDETVLASIVRIKKKKLKMIDLDITENTMLTETTRLILHKDKKYNFKKIYIDDGGLGVGVYDPLLEHPQTKRKVIAINNSSRSLEKLKDKNRQKRLLKEDLYNNLKVLMENDQIELFNKPEVRQSLRSIQYEITDERKLRIYGNYSHITEALIRAAWCTKDKTLNIYIY